MKQSNQLLQAIVAVMHKENALDIVTLDLKPISGTITDYFVLCTVHSTTQAEGLIEAIIKETKKIGEQPWTQQGLTNKNWVILDYIETVVHIFLAKTRAFYSLEERWADAERI